MKKGIKKFDFRKKVTTVLGYGLVCEKCGVIEIEKNVRTGETIKYPHCESKRTSDLNYIA
jgi:hypothetical protein